MLEQWYDSSEEKEFSIRFKVRRYRAIIDTEFGRREVAAYTKVVVILGFTELAEFGPYDISNSDTHAINKAQIEFGARFKQLLSEVKLDAKPVH